MCMPIFSSTDLCMSNISIYLLNLSAGKSQMFKLYLSIYHKGFTDNNLHEYYSSLDRDN